MANKYWWAHSEYSYYIFVNERSNERLMVGLKDISIDVDQAMGFQRYIYNFLTYTVVNESLETLELVTSNLSSSFITSINTHKISTRQILGSATAPKGEQAYRENLKNMPLATNFLPPAIPPTWTARIGPPFKSLSIRCLLYSVEGALPYPTLSEKLSLSSSSIIFLARGRADAANSICSASKIWRLSSASSVHRHPVHTS